MLITIIITTFKKMVLISVPKVILILLPIIVFLIFITLLDEDFSDIFVSLIEIIMELIKISSLVEILTLKLGRRLNKIY